MAYDESKMLLLWMLLLWPDKLFDGRPQTSPPHCDVIHAFATSHDYFSGVETEQHDGGVVWSVNKPGKQCLLISAVCAINFVHAIQIQNHVGLSAYFYMPHYVLYRAIDYMEIDVGNVPFEHRDNSYTSKNAFIPSLAPS
jgi:hypothetical protein